MAGFRRMRLPKCKRGPIPAALDLRQTDKLLLHPRPFWLSLDRCQGCTRTCISCNRIVYNRLVDPPMRCCCPDSNWPASTRQPAEFSLSELRNRSCSLLGWETGPKTSQQSSWRHELYFAPGGLARNLGWGTVPERRFLRRTHHVPVAAPRMSKSNHR